MATDLVESGLVAVSLAEEQAGLGESRLVLVTRAELQATFIEAGLTVIARAELNHRLVEFGLIVITKDEAGVGGPGIQASLEIQGVAQGSGIANLGPSAVGQN